MTVIADHLFLGFAPKARSKDCAFRGRYFGGGASQPPGRARHIRTFPSAATCISPALPSTRGEP